jgi:hypothetical protein
MLPPSGTSLPGNSTAGITQEIRVVNSMQGEKNIMLKLKIKYNQGSASVSDEIMIIMVMCTHDGLTGRGISSSVIIPKPVLKSIRISCYAIILSE